MRYLWLVLLVASPLRAQRLSGPERGLQAAVIVSSIMDAALTVDILSRGGIEHNPILGQHPSSAKIVVYQTATIAGMFWLTPKLPRPWRALFLAGFLAVECRAVGLNLRY